MATDTPLVVAEKRLLGTGLAFPMRATASGHIAGAYGRDLVRQSVEVLVMTDPLERPYRVRGGIPYGTRIRRFLFDDIETIREVAVVDIRRAIAVWEPRVSLTDVVVEEDTEVVADKGAAVRISISYVIRATAESDFNVIRLNKEART